MDTERPSPCAHLITVRRALASLLVGGSALALAACQLSLPERSPNVMDLDPQWFEYEPDLTEEELAGVGAELMADPVADATGGAGILPGSTPGAGETSDPDLFFDGQGTGSEGTTRGMPSPVPGEYPGTTVHPDDPVRRAAGRGAGDTPRGPTVLSCQRPRMEPIPAPAPLARIPAVSPVATDVDDTPMQPAPIQPAAPGADRPEQAPPSALPDPAPRSDRGLGTPPSGPLGLPPGFDARPDAQPAVERPDSPEQPRSTEQPGAPGGTGDGGGNASESEDDPWATSPEDDPLLGGGDQAPAVPAPTETPRPPAEPAGAPEPDDDPWALPAGPASTAPESTGTAPGTVTPPGSTPPGSMPETAGPDDDPWGGEDPLGASPLAPGTTPTTTDTGFRETTREGRALEQVTRLIARPGDANVEGYPDAILVKAEPWVALREGPRPLVLIFYDNALRTSDELAAEILPTLARYSTKVDVVAIDRSPSHELTSYEQQVVSRYLGQSDDVPVVAVANARRKTLLARFAWFPASDLEAALRKALELPALTMGAEDAPRPQPRDPLAEDPPRGPGSRVPPGFERERPGVLPDPMTDGRRDTPRDPLMSGPRDNVPREGGLSMGGPRVEQARAHASRLRANPSDARIGGYPRSLLERARPRTALEPGHKPVVIVFYDDASRASNLQAGDILPVLVAEQNRVDVVVINVSRGHERTDDETDVVKPYYPGSVPATVVLSASRAPVKLWFQRTSARSLQSALREAKAKR